MSIFDRIHVQILDEEMRTGKKAIQVVLGEAEADELFSLGDYDGGATTFIGVPVVFSIRTPNGITVITNKEDMR